MTLPIQRIKEAWINVGHGAGSLVFDQGEVNLFKIINDEPGKTSHYFVGDSTDKKCPDFRITRDSVIVTEKNITIRWFDQTFILTLFDKCDTFAFYRRFFTNWITTVSFDVQ